MTPEGWSRRTLSEIVERVTTGVSVNSESRPRGAGEIGVLKTSAVTYGTFRPDENKAVMRQEVERAREHPRAGCVLFSRMNTLALVGASALVNEDRPDLVLPDRIWQLLPASVSDGRWLHSLLSSPSVRARLSELASGTSGSMKNISQEKLLGLDVLLPPLAEQRKIAAILASVDDAIEAKRAVIDQLDVVKAAMMAELLTRGLPGRHMRFKTTDIGEVPGEWEVVPFEALLADGDSLSYGILQPGDDDPAGVPMLRTVDLDDHGGRSNTTILRVRRSVETQYERTRLRGGDVLLSVMGTVGRTAVVPSEWNGWNVNRALAVVRVNSRVTPDYLSFWLRSPATQDRFAVEQIGSAQKRINLSDLRQMLVPLPGTEEQSQLCATFTACEQRRALEAHSLSQLRSVKSALMSVLLTGEVRVNPDEEAA